MEPGERLRALREARGLSALELAQRVDRSESAVRNQENGTNGIPPALAKRYAAVLGTTAAYILYGDDPPEEPKPPELMMLEIGDRVQAGAWLQQEEDFGGFEERERYPAARDPRYPHAPQWLSPVVGDSMNQAGKGGIIEGDLAHIVDIWDSGWRPRTGDIVMVERIRFQGREREETLKEVEVTPAGTVLLWPRSSNPRWKDPIRLNEPGVNPEDVEVRIRGLLLNVIRRFG